MNKHILISLLAGCFIFTSSILAEEKADESGREKRQQKKESAVKKDTVKTVPVEPVETSVPLPVSSSEPNNRLQHLIDLTPDITTIRSGEQINWQVFPTGASFGSAPGLILSSITGQTFVGDGATVAGDIHLSTGFWQDFNIQTCCVDIRGNVDNGVDDGGYTGIDIRDLVRLAAFMLAGDPPPECFYEADVDGTDLIDISDLVFLVNFMFADGPEPLACP